MDPARDGAVMQLQQLPGMSRRMAMAVLAREDVTESFLKTIPADVTQLQIIAPVRTVRTTCARTSWMLVCATRAVSSCYIVGGPASQRC